MFTVPETVAPLAGLEIVSALAARGEGLGLGFGDGAGDGIARVPT
jgi:hypothetical protein